MYASTRPLIFRPPLFRVVGANVVFSVKGAQESVWARSADCGSIFVTLVGGLLGAYVLYVAEMHAWMYIGHALLCLGDACFVCAGMCAFTSAGARIGVFHWRYWQGMLLFPHFFVRVWGRFGKLCLGDLFSTVSFTATGLMVISFPCFSSSTLTDSGTRRDGR